MIGLAYPCVENWYVWKFGRQQRFCFHAFWIEYSMWKDNDRESERATGEKESKEEYYDNEYGVSDILGRIGRCEWLMDE